MGLLKTSLPCNFCGNRPCLLVTVISFDVTVLWGRFEVICSEEAISHLFLLKNWEDATCHRLN